MLLERREKRYDRVKVAAYVAWAIIGFRYKAVCAGNFAHFAVMAFFKIDTF